MFDALRLMRIPFSVFLMPVFWFSTSTLSEIKVSNALFIFLILHLLLYPASNGYNSYFDKDEESIGGLKNPPKINTFLFPLVVVFDILSIGLSLILFDITFAALLLVYMFVSKAYSYKNVRLKKYPVLSTLSVTIFQGFFIFISVQYGITESWYFLNEPFVINNAIISSLLLLGTYPLTQVYQHEEDKKRGDQTISLLLGKIGTFLFSFAAILIGSAYLVFNYLTFNREQELIIIGVCLLPVGLFLMNWFRKVTVDLNQANFNNTMKMNAISSILMSAAFIIITLI